MSSGDRVSLVKSSLSLGIDLVCKHPQVVLLDWVPGDSADLVCESIIVEKGNIGKAMLLQVLVKG